MYIKTFKLKQHTPIIHFQSGENGATLRASEVKPKLDKFLIKRLGKDNINKEWKRRDENGEIALDYGLSFTVNEPEEPIKISKSNAPMFFGNIGESDPKKLVFTKGDIIGKIKIKNEKLLEKIKTYLAEFFFLHNFGTRQSKGYGSFTCEAISNEKTNFEFSSNYSFSIAVDNWKKVMMHLDIFYRSLRSGLNIGSPNTTNSVNSSHPNAKGSSVMNTKFYMKPAIFFFARHLNEQWDKKTIKQNYFNKDYYYRPASRTEKEKLNINNFGSIETEGLPKQKARYNNSDILNYNSDEREGLKYDFRDLFGLSSDEEWYSYNAKVKKENSNIKRFKSPITFKVLKSPNGYNVYIILSPINPKYKGAKFKIKSKEYRETKDSLTLQIPIDFEMNNLFEFISSENFDLNNSVDEKFHQYEDENSGINYYNALTNVYSQLNNQN